MTASGSCPPAGRAAAVCEQRTAVWPSFARIGTVSDVVGAPAGPVGSPGWPPVHRDVPQQWNAGSMLVLAMFTGAVELVLGYWASQARSGLP